MLDRRSAEPSPPAEVVARGEAAQRRDRLASQAPAQPNWHFTAARALSRLGVALLTGIRVEGGASLPAGPSILCFSHLNWTDPIFLLAALPASPRTHFFGPAQEDMRTGLRNRVMRWMGTAVPYQPGKRGLAAAMRRVEALLAAGERLAIAGEGRIHSGEAVILPLEKGPAYMALRFGVPIVPVAVNGTSWLALRRRVRVRFGQPIDPPAVERVDLATEAVETMTEAVRTALLGMVSDFPDPPRSRWLGGWLTELFNDWPEGSRPTVPPRG
jgi:1-acyl-sn-glycerol-3-phosphate acyltransferase